MPLKIELNENEKIKWKWEDLEYGDIFITDGEIAMKVKSDIEEKDYILFLDNFDLYPDVKEYKIHKVINCKLVKDEN